MECSSGVDYGRKGLKMNVSAELIVMIIAYVASIGCLYGAISTKIDTLTKQVEKHNGVIERQFNLEKQFEKDKEHIEGRIDLVEKEVEMHHPK